MPTYSYECQKCGTSFELFFYIKDYQEHPRCVGCECTATMRKYTEDLRSLNMSVKKSDSELKTIGDLANRNRDRLSEDQKKTLYKKHNSYKEQESQKALPQGMSRIDKKSIKKTKWR